MEKSIIWYSLLLKKTLKKRVTWIILVVMFILIWVISGIDLPDRENVTVGILTDDGIYSTQITQLLERSEGVFDFVEYQDKEQLREDIVSQKIISGFWYDEQFDEKVERQSIDQLITFATTPSQSKAGVTSETVYAAFLQVYSKVILEDSERQIFADHSEKRMTEIMSRFQQYLDSSDIFQVEKEILASTTNSSEKLSEQSTYQVQGMVGLMVLLVMFLSGSSDKSKSLSGVRQVLIPRERILYDFLSQIASATPFAVAGLLLIASSKQTRGLGAEILAMLILLLYGSLWNLIVQRFIHTETGVIAGILVMVVTNLTICPVVMDLGQYLPAISYIRIIFPLGVYLL